MIVAVVEYHDRYRRIGADWLIADRRAVIAFPTSAGATPDTSQ